MNGKNGLACITPLSAVKASKIVLRPLPGLPVIRDLDHRLNTVLQSIREN